MATDKILLVQGDTRPQLLLSLIDENSGTPIDLSAAGTETVVKFREAGADTLTATMPTTKLLGAVREDGTINYNAPYNVPGAGGRVAMDWAPDALAQPGEYQAEIETTFADGGVQTAYQLLRFKVREQFT